MRVSGFTFIRNAVKFGYPIAEAIQSVLPLCDEFVIALGHSDDATEALIKSIPSNKIRVIPSVWDETLKEGGTVLAVETNKALKEVSKEADWCIYIQGDECIHEDDYDSIRKAMHQYKDHPEVEGLLFDYLHFYGTYEYISDSFARYRREVRIIRNNCGISSWGDAQGFRKNGQKLKVKRCHASIYHYGWVKPPKQQQERFRYMHTLWHAESKVDEMLGKSGEFDYANRERLHRFKGTHPAVIKSYIQQLNWKLPYDPTTIPYQRKILIKKLVYKLSGWRMGEYRNYILK